MLTDDQLDFHVVRISLDCIQSSNTIDNCSYQYDLVSEISAESKYIFLFSKIIIILVFKSMIHPECHSKFFKLARSPTLFNPNSKCYISKYRIKIQEILKFLTSYKISSEHHCSLSFFVKIKNVFNIIV